MLEHQTDLTFAKISQVSNGGFYNVVYETVYLEAFINNQQECIAVGCVLTAAVASVIRCQY